MHTLTMCDIFKLPYPPNRQKVMAPENAEWRTAIKWSGTDKSDDVRRTFAKRFGFRIDYGGDPKYAMDIPGARVLFGPGGVGHLVEAAEAYLAADPAYKKWRGDWVAHCLRRGEVESFGGRRRKLVGTPQDNAKIAMNTPMQAGVVDVFNKVAVDAYRALPNAQWVYGVHDRQIWACREGDEELTKATLQTIAEQAFTIRGRSVTFPISWKETRHG